jgi:mannitol/fructose-specific phosphotransferase system IIA component (Ntr-type)
VNLRGGARAEPEKPVEYVFLSLSPLANPEIQVRLLALAARILQNRHLSQALRAAADAREVQLALKSWEESSPSPKAAPPNIFH